MTSLPEFLEARIGEDEQAARATEHADGAGTLHWRPAGSRRHRFDNGRGESYSAVFTGEWDRIQVARDDVAGGPLAEHIARHDPARVLAEVAAIRALLAHEDTYGEDDHVARFLALPYAEHPDYRPEWAPRVEGEG